MSDLAIDCEERRVTLAGLLVELTATAFDLLSQLSANAGRVLTHEDLLWQVWAGAEQGQQAGDARVRETAAAQAGRRRGQTEVRLQRAACWLTHAKAGRRRGQPRHSRQGPQRPASRSAVARADFAREAPGRLESARNTRNSRGGV